MRNNTVFLQAGDTVSSGSFVYEIIQLEGCGSRTAAYRVQYKDNAGHLHRHILKECLPEGLRNCMTRNANGEIEIEEPSKLGYFLEEQEKFTQACALESEIEKSLSHSGSFAYDCFSANGTRYAVTHWVEGKTLSEWLETDFHTGETYNLEALLRIFAYLASVLEAIHKQGFVYLDISPKNIFIPNTVKDFQTCRLIDFDSIKKVETIEAAEVRASSDFSAPEVRLCDTKSIDFSSDYFALSALLFYALFGRPVYDDELYSMLMPSPKYAQMLRTGDTENLAFLQKQPPHIGEELADFFISTLTIKPSTRKIDAISQTLNTLAKDIAEGQFLLPQRIHAIEPFGKSELDLLTVDRMLDKTNILFLSGAPGIGKRSFAKWYAYNRRTKYHAVQTLDGSAGLAAALHALTFKPEVPQQNDTDADMEMRLRALEHCKHSVLLIIENYNDALLETEDNTQTLPPQIQARAAQNHKILKALHHMQNTSVLITRDKNITAKEKRSLSSLAAQMRVKEPSESDAIDFFTAQFSDSAEVLQQLQDFCAKTDNAIDFKTLLTDHLGLNFAYMAYAAEKIKQWVRNDALSIEVCVQRLSEENDWLKAEHIPAEYQQILSAICILTDCKKDLTRHDLEIYGIVDKDSAFFTYAEEKPWILIDAQGQISVQKGFHDFILNTICPTVDNPIFSSYKTAADAWLQTDLSVLTSALILLFSEMERHGYFKSDTDCVKIEKLFKSFSETLSRALSSAASVQISESVLLRWFILQTRVAEKYKQKRLRRLRIASGTAAAVLALVLFTVYMVFGRISVQVAEGQKIDYNYEADTIVLSDIAFYRNSKNVTASLSNAEIKRYIKSKNITFDSESITVAYQADLSQCTIEIPNCTFNQEASVHQIRIGNNPLKIKGTAFTLTPYAQKTEVRLFIDGWDCYQREADGKTAISFTLSMFGEQPFEIASENIADFLTIADVPVSEIASSVFVDTADSRNTDTEKHCKITFYTTLPCGKYRFTVKSGLACNTETGRPTEAAHRVFEITDRIVDMSIPNYSVFSLRGTNPTVIQDGDSIAYRIEYKRTDAVTGTETWPYQYCADALKAKFQGIGFTYSDVEILNIYDDKEYFEKDTLFAQTVILHSVVNQPETEEKVLCIPQGIAVSANGRTSPYKQIDITGDYLFSTQKTDFTAPRITEVRLTSTNVREDIGLHLFLTDNNVLGQTEQLNINPNFIQVIGATYKKTTVRENIRTFNQNGSPFLCETFISLQNITPIADEITITFQAGFFQDTQGNLSESFVFKISKADLENTIQTVTPADSIPLQVISDTDFQVRKGALNIQITAPNSADVDCLPNDFMFEGFTANMILTQTDANTVHIRLRNIQPRDGANKTNIHISGGVFISADGKLSAEKTIEVKL